MTVSQTTPPDHRVSSSADTVDKSSPQVRRMFGEIAGRYDFLNHLLSLNADRFWRWRTVRAVRPVAGDRILDVCTGTGDLALAFGRNGQDGTRVVAADFCHEMLVLGQRKGQKMGMAQRVNFVEADTLHLPFPPDHFHVVTVAFGLRNVADTDQGLVEMARVCAPGGRVAVLEFSMPTWHPFRAIYQWYFRHVLPRIGQMISGNRTEAYHYLPQSVSEFPSGEALAARMREAGLSPVAIHPLTFGIATLYVGVKKETE